MITNNLDTHFPVVSDNSFVTGGISQDTCETIVEDGTFATAGGMSVLTHSLIGFTADPEPVTKTFCGFVSIMAGVVSAVGVGVSLLAASVSNASQ